jgi:UDP-glucose 4-epimerase
VTVLVTGAAGFLGRRVVTALADRGESVRALVRGPGDAAQLGFPAGVEVARGDLRRPETLVGAVDGVDAVVHLAAAVAGDEEAAFSAAVVGTEHLLAALGGGLRRFVLAGSVAVYDWGAARGTIDEDTPLVGEPWARGGYTVAKLWQERVVREAAATGRFQLVVLRPGFIWGPGNDAFAGVGQRVRGRWLVITGGARLPVTYVENCADCFALCVRDERAAHRTFNVIDGDGVDPRAYARAHLMQRGERAPLVPVPYPLAYGAARLARRTSVILFGPGGKLPSVLDPPRFEARFKPVRWSAARLRNELGWHPPVAFDEALRRTYAPALTA